MSGAHGFQDTIADEWSANLTLLGLGKSCASLVRDLISCKENIHVPVAPFLKRSLGATQVIYAACVRGGTTR